MLSYINEAFRSLETLNEDIFASDDEGIRDLSTFMDDQTEDTIRVFDPEASSEEDLKPSYVGKIIAVCNVCHSPVLKNKEDITIEDNVVSNVDDPCPCCGECEGFMISGQITDFKANDEMPVNDSVDEQQPVESQPTNEQPVQEAYGRNDRKFVSRKRTNVIDEATLYTTKAEMDKLDKAVEDARKEVTKYKIKEKRTYPDGVEADLSEVPEDQREAAQKAYDNYKKALAARPSRSKTNIQYVDESLNESVNNVNVETDNSIVNVSAEENGKITVTTEPITNAVNEGEVISPLTDEIKDEIAAQNADNIDEEEDTMSEVEFDIDDIDEESVNELGEAYLKQVYENVDTFNVSNVSSTDSRLIIEGVIAFKSGAKKTTGFILESVSATKNGKVKFVGENKHLCRGNKAFTLTGKVEDKKLIAESFTYNYKAKTHEGKSTRVYGTVRTAQK